MVRGLGGIGFLETAYLTYLKLTNSDAFCPTGGASCTTILTSDYSSVFGVPLPLFGMLAYGLVTVLGLQLGAKEKTFDIGKTDGEIILIGITTSMAVASAYFLYILNTEFVGELCIYCLASAVLSFSLFFITQKRFGSHDLQKLLGLQLSVAGLVVLALTASYNSVQPISSSVAATEIPYFETKIASKSSPLAISLAKHLRAIGAKLYGAFWCSHCQDQKEPKNSDAPRLFNIRSTWRQSMFIYLKIFGREAAKLLDYVECFPDGVSKGTKMAQACVDVNLEGGALCPCNIRNNEQRVDKGDRINVWRTGGCQGTRFLTCKTYKCCSIGYEAISLGSGLNENQLVWHHDAYGIFSVGSAYRLALELTEKGIPSGTVSIIAFDWLEGNFDGAVFADQKEVGAGVIARDEISVCLVYQTR
ncbi:UNVERIFIED_CONTAM: Thiol-disulfide oxidoreductase LTO1 [Sesamum calycinum]|uniref:Thiol-disulfide oxidoreductase LTO1 n=1 Tax=Sesamum calycinum TaxID=2727403 RepID=A0AAW2SXK5_9LAMI